MMKAPRKLKADLGNNFSYQFLENKQDRNKFGIMYDQKQQTATAGINHPYTTIENKVVYRKRASKPRTFRIHNRGGEKAPEA